MSALNKKEIHMSSECVEIEKAVLVLSSGLQSYEDYFASGEFDERGSAYVRGCMDALSLAIATLESMKS